MAELRDVMAYLIARYPSRHELSNARLTKMVYLADWKHAIEHGRQITDVRWYFDNFGPWVPDVVNTARQHPSLFAVREGWTGFGNRKTTIDLVDEAYRPAALDTDERASLDHVLKTTPHLSFEAFIQLVYSTYPIRKSDRYTWLDLPALAAEYAFERPSAVGEWAVHRPG